MARSQQQQQQSNIINNNNNNNNKVASSITILGTTSTANECRTNIFEHFKAGLILRVLQLIMQFVNQLRY